MNNLDISVIMLIMTTILLIYIMINSLLTMFEHGKLILKVETYKGLTIFSLLMVFLWIYSLYQSKNSYSLYGEYSTDFRDIDSINNNFIWIELSILTLFRCLRGSEIRENGIYKNGWFYKWSKIRSYIWTTPTTIQFKVKSLFVFNREFEMTIKDEFKLKADEILQKHLSL